VLLSSTAHPAQQDAPAQQKKGKKSAPAPPGITGEHVVVVRVYDREDNPATAKYVVR
jgi:hypothetical protein